MRIVAGGYRESLVLLDFDPSTAKIKTISESPVPKNPSWVEPSTKHPNVLYSLAEDEEHGKVFSLELKGDKYELTAERDSDAAPCHIHYMKDGSGIMVANYVAGTVRFFPVNADGSLSTKSESAPLKFPFAYEGKTAPNTERQDQPHAHMVIETPDGTIFAVDLGSDRIWAIERDGESGLKVKGWLQCPPGSGPRHVAVSPNGEHLYVLTEMGHSLLLFSIKNPSYPVHPTPDFELNIVPDTVPVSHQKYMDSAEIALNPAHPNVVYASNRAELHIHEKLPDLPRLPTQKGDTVCVVSLSSDGGKIKAVKQVRTECDGIRGMQVSKDGKYVVLAGQNGGGVEVWQIGGKGEEWKLAAKEESIKGITDFVWLA